ncbi:hypothetical protein [Dyella subtropica]|uniref:hypothetical protein n=1 Tax=Dyella subtropica TaxID=2992127 RepID=UPI00224E2936|nr:hypothetical protein [Dyella subtropica]
MSNRVYLCCTDHFELPTEDGWDAFFNASGTEYEAVASVPLFWLCLFGSNDIRIAVVDQSIFEGEDSRSYAYLCCSKEAGLARLRARASVIAGVLGEERQALYAEWVARMEGEPFKHVLVRTEELDMMGEAGELEALLRNALTCLESSEADGTLTMSDDLRNVAGLGREAVLDACESFELAGMAGVSEPWPARYNPPYVPPVAELKKKAWWQFWA